MRQLQAEQSVLASHGSGMHQTPPPLNLDGGWHTAYVIVALLFSGVGLALLRQNLYDVDFAGPEGDQFSQALFSALYFGIVILALRQPNVLGTALRKSWPVMLLAALSVASSCWSNVPAITLRRSIALLATTTTGAILGTVIGPRKYVELLYKVLALAMLVSLAFLIATPWGTAGPIGDYSWNGAMVHKNALGRIAALSAITSGYVALHERRKHAAVFTVLSLVLLLGSSSRTALISFAVAVAVGAGAANLVRGRSYLLPSVVAFFIASITVGGAVVANSGTSLAAAVGRDETFSGRTPLWDRLLEDVRAKPLLGYGYSAYWSNADGPASAVRGDVGWNAPHAHNGFLDVALQLGCLGLIALVGSVIGVSRRLINLLTRRSRPEIMWAIMFAVFWICTNLTETAVLVRNDLMWATYAGIGAITFQLQKPEPR